MSWSGVVVKMENRTLMTRIGRIGTDSIRADSLNPQNPRAIRIG